MSHRFLRASQLVLVAIISFGILASPGRGQDELPDDVRANILKKLKNLSVQAEEKSFSKFSNASAKYSAAAASLSAASSFYFECINLVDFERRGRSFSDFRKWKERNLEAVREDDFQTALQIQLELLTLTIRYLNMEDKTKIVQPLETFLHRAVVAEKSIRGGARQKLNEDVSQTVFAEAYNLDKALGELGNWELQPLNLSGHYQNTILPILRENASTESIEAAWNRMIKLEGRLVTNLGNKALEEEFEKNQHPALLWDKWSDVADHGGRSKAAPAMLSLIEKNLSHPDAQDWILDLEDVANGRRLAE